MCANQSSFFQVAWNVVSKVSEIALTSVELYLCKDIRSSGSINSGLLQCHIAFDSADQVFEDLSYRVLPTLEFKTYKETRADLLLTLCRDICRREGGELQLVRT